MKKVLSISICFMLILSMSFSSFANKKLLYNNGKTKVIQDNESVRIARTITDDKIIESIYDKKKNTLTTKIKDRISKKLTKQNVINLNTNEINESEYDSNGDTIQSLRYEISGENTFSNYEYERYSDESWQLRRPQDDSLNYVYMNVDENPNNYEYLLNFQDHVEEINSLELQILVDHSISKLLQGITVILGLSGAGTGAAVATGLAAIGFTAAAIDAGIGLHEEMEDAKEDYFLVKRYSPEYH